MDYRKPSKAAANEDFMRAMGMIIGEPYKEEAIEQKKTFLIVCEGANTEPLYFEGFPVPSKTVVTEGGHGSKTALVNYADKIRKLAKHEGREVWCVFDFDIKPDEAATQPEDFNNAIIKAEQLGMKTAWSNDAFELWFLLHYQSLESALTRKEIYKILKDKWQLESFSSEAKTVDFCMGHYDRHMEGTNGASQKLAIRRARTLNESYGTKQNYAEQIPCTTVYLLVEELNKNLK
jgi:RloB-like protein